MADSFVEVSINGRFYSYKLNGSYVFASGKKRGESVEALMFSQRSYLVKLKRIRDINLTRDSRPDRLHLHLAWILNAGEFVKPLAVCQYCPDDRERNKLRFFSVRYSGGACSYGHEHTSCEDPNCKWHLVDERSTIFPFKFSSLSYFRNAEQKRMGAFFKDVFLGSGRLDSEMAFQMFLSASHTVKP